jgi:hypothetical protein
MLDSLVANGDANNTGSPGQQKWLLVPRQTSRDRYLRLHLKTRSLVARVGDDDFSWVDDEISAADQNGWLRIIQERLACCRLTPITSDRVIS